MSTLSARVAKKSRSRVVRSPTPHTRSAAPPARPRSAAPGTDRDNRHKSLLERTQAHECWRTRRAGESTVPMPTRTYAGRNSSSHTSAACCWREHDQEIRVAAFPQDLLVDTPEVARVAQGRIQPARRSIGSTAEDLHHACRRQAVPSRSATTATGRRRAVGTELITSSVPAAPTCHGGLTWSLWGFGALAQARPTRGSRQCDERLRYRSARHESPLRRCVSRRIAESLKPAPAALGPRPRCQFGNPAERLLANVVEQKMQVCSFGERRPKTSPNDCVQAQQTHRGMTARSAGSQDDPQGGCSIRQLWRLRTLRGRPAHADQGHGPLTR